MTDLAPVGLLGDARTTGLRETSCTISTSPYGFLCAPPWSWEWLLHPSCCST